MIQITIQDKINVLRLCLVQVGENISPGNFND